MLTVYCPQRTSTWGLSERTEKLETRLVGLKSTVTLSWLMKSYARILAERKDGAQQNINTPSTIKKGPAVMIFASGFRRVSRPLGCTVCGALSAWKYYYRGTSGSKKRLRCNKVSSLNKRQQLLLWFLNGHGEDAGMGIFTKCKYIQYVWHTRFSPFTGLMPTS